MGTNMRIAYVGLSSPTAYLFNFKQYVHENEFDWNPILESPQGLSVLYDEIWFLHRALCPFTMLNLPFVRFVSEREDILLDSIVRILFFKEEYYGSTNDYKNLIPYVDLHSGPDFAEYSEHINKIFGHQPSRQFPIDNHSMRFQFLNVDVGGNSQKGELLLYDLLILGELQKRYPKYRYELVTNKFTTPRILYRPNEQAENQVAHDFIIQRIKSNCVNVPAIHSEIGPNVDFIQAIRETNLFIDFREKVLLKVEDEGQRIPTEIDIEKIKADLMQEFNNYVRMVINSTPSPIGVVWSYTSQFLRFASYFLPEPYNKVRGVAEIVDKAIEINKETKYRWARFVMALDNEIKTLEK